MKKGNTALAAKIDEALAGLGPEIAALAVKYHFPRAEPIVLNAFRAPPVAAVKVPAAYFVPVAGTVAAAAPSTKSAAAEEGRLLFNNHCSHCHAPNAQSPVPERDLRRLKRRYGESWRQSVIGTIKEGRPNDGMPGWKDLIDDERLKTLLAFFETIQREP